MCFDHQVWLWNLIPNVLSTRHVCIPWAASKARVCPTCYNRMEHLPCSERHPHDDVIKWKHFPRNWWLALCAGNSPMNSPHKGQWRRALMFFFDLRPIKRLSKQSWGWWFETPSCSLWRHCNVATMHHSHHVHGKGSIYAAVVAGLKTGQVIHLAKQTRVAAH